jgi:hypothetical protein
MDEACPVVFVVGHPVTTRSVDFFFERSIGRSYCRRHSAVRYAGTYVLLPNTQNVRDAQFDRDGTCMSQQSRLRVQYETRYSAPPIGRAETTIPFERGLESTTTTPKGAIHLKQHVWSHD